MIPPIAFRWDGQAMVPSHQVVADRHFIIGERYTLVEHADRSGASHRHYFACLHDVWSNLPDDMVEQLPSAEHLRKFCLIKAGYCDKRDLTLANAEMATAVAEAMRALDEYAVIVAVDGVVAIYTAKSQSLAAMGKRDFQASKDMVLQIAASLIGASPDQLGRAA